MLSQKVKYMKSALMFFAMRVIKTKKREGPKPVTRPAFRGSGMPFTIERATQSLTPTCI